MCTRLQEGNPSNPFECAATTLFEEVAAIVTFQHCPIDAASFENLETMISIPMHALLTVAGSVMSVVTVVFQMLYDFFKILRNDETHLNPQAVELTQNLKVNRAKISELPPPLEIHELQDLPNIELQELLTHCELLFDRSHHIAYQIQLQGYVYYVEGLQASESVRDRNLVAAAKNLIFELRKPEISREKKETALVDLAYAYSSCEPRIYEETLRQLKFLTNRFGTLEQQLPFWLQHLKEEIIIENYQVCEFHVINHARRHVPDWGLDRDRVNLSDPFQDLMGGFNGALNYRYTLNKEYNPPRIIEAIRNRFLRERSNDLLNDYLQRHPLPDHLSFEECFEADRTTISYRAVVWIHEQEGFLIHN